MSSMEERRWMLTASGVCWSFCLTTYFVQLDLFRLSNTQDIIAACFVYFGIAFFSLGYLFACWLLATKIVLPGIPFLLGKTLVPPPFFNPNHPDYVGDLEEDEDDDPLFTAALNLLLLKLATKVVTFNDMIHSNKVYLWGLRMAQLVWVLSPFFVLNLIGVVGSDFEPAVFSLGFTSLMGEGYLLIFGVECFKSFYGLLVAALAGFVFITSRNNNYNFVATLIVCLMSALITCLCGLYLFLLSRTEAGAGASTAGTSAADDDAPSPSQASPPVESAV